MSWRCMGCAWHPASVTVMGTIANNCNCYRSDRAVRSKANATDGEGSAPMRKFPANAIMSLVAAAPRYDLAESIGPNAVLKEIIDLFDVAEMQLAYGTAPGDPKLRAMIAQAHGVTADAVVVTMGGMHALFLLAFILCGGDGEAVITQPAFPPARDCLHAVGACVKTLPLAFERRYQPDLAHLRTLLSRRTRLVSLASPQNPSGVAIPAATVGQILAM